MTRSMRKPAAAAPRAGATAPLLLLALAIAAAATAPRALADPLPLLDYHTAGWFLPQSPSVAGGPVGGLFNPGAFGMSDRGGTDLWIDDRDGHLSFNRFGFAAGRTFNVAMNRSLVEWQGGRAAINDWQVGLAGGGRAGSLGLAYRWAGGAPAGALRDRALVLGLVSRPARWLTWGASRAQSLQADAAQNILDLGLRPARAPWRRSRPRPRPPGAGCAPDSW